MLKTIKKSLTLRIAFPVISLIILLWIMLELFVLSVISDITRAEIDRDLRSLSRRINNICNINFENLLMEGKADNMESLIIRQAMVLGQIEDFFVQEDLTGLVYDHHLNDIVLKRNLPSDPGIWMDETGKTKSMDKLKEPVKGWFAYYDMFPPWDWQIVILKNKKEYSALKTRIRQIHTNTLIILSLASVLLIVLIYQTIKRPVNTIIHPIKKGEKPDYHGIDTFEFLSDSIAGMMDSIKQNEEKYRSLVETTTGFVWEVDEKACYTFASGTITDILGYTPSEVLGKSVYFSMPQEEKERNRHIFSQKAFNKEPFEEIINKNIHKQGRTVMLETKGVPIISKKGELLGYRGINKDITEALRAQEEHKELARHRQQIQRLEAIGTLAAGLAHDFNNLLSVIMGNVSLAKIEVKKAPHIVDFLNEAEKASIRAGELAGQRITFSKGGMPFKKKGLMEESIKEVADAIVLNRNNIHLRYDIGPGLFKIEFDRVQMKQVFGNLIRNAVEAMPDGGLIEVEMRNFKIGESTESVLPALIGKRYIKVTVKDQGRGILPRDLEKVFDPYFTTKEMGTQKGAGLGLTTAYSVVARHDGRIIIHSKPGKGTRVAVYMPAVEKGRHPVAGHKVVAAEPEKESRQPSKVLLMDDEEMIRTLAKATLSRLGYQADVCTEGSAVVRQYQAAMNQGTPYDIVILDLTVKEGMGGLACIQELLEIDPDVIAIVSSGYATDPVMTDFQQYGFKLALPKPYNRTQLAKMICRVMGRAEKNNGP